MIHGVQVLFWSIILIGPSLITYLSYQKFLREAHILVKIIAPIFIFAVSFAAITFALVIVFVAAFGR